MGELITKICKRTVVSTKPVQAGKFFSLSVLDRLMERNHLRIVYYFQTLRGNNLGEITKKLRESLSEMLTCYPIVTGRLMKEENGHWKIKCNDAGVRMVEARAKGSVQQWLQNADKDIELLLIHWEEIFHKPYFWSTFYVQLTEFEEGGLAIGLSCFHPLADLTSATIFIKAWADTTLTGKMISPPLFHPLPPRRPGNKDPYHQPYTHLINHYKSIVEKSNLTTPTSHKYETIALLLSDATVRSCVELTRTPVAPNSPSPSPFQAIAGIFWDCISKVKGKEDGLIDMSLCLDMRKVLGLDYGYFGNCMIYNKVKSKSSNPTKNIQEEMSKMDIEGIMDLIEWLESNDWQSPPLMNGCDLICTNLEGVDPYLAMFEQGFAPIRVSYHVEPVGGAGHVLVLPSPPSEGEMSRVVMVTLPNDQMVRLCNDDRILSLAPTILMKMKKKMNS